MRAMTYNILTGGWDGDSTVRWPKLVEVIQREQPDVLALQECNLFDIGGNQRLHELERNLGMRGLIAKARSGFHVALFLRKHVEVIRSEAVNSWCEHAMLRARLQLGGRQLEVTALHADPFSGTGRLREAEYLAGQARAEEWQLIVGDFNANSPKDKDRIELAKLPARYRSRQGMGSETGELLDTRSLQKLLNAGYVDIHDKHREQDWEATVPTALVAERQRYPMRIDFVLASQALSQHSTRLRVVRDSLTDAASDHYPLVADFLEE